MLDSADALRVIARAPILAAPISFRYRPEPGRHAVEGDLILADYGYPGPAFHEVVVTGPLPPEQVFARAGAFFGGAAYSVLVESEVAQPTEDALRAAGWVLDEDEPALVLTPIPPSIPAPPADLVIELVSTETGLDDFLALSRTPRHWVPSLAFVRDPAVALFVGYVAGEPVATSRLVCCGEVGDITGVNTAPAYRRRGFGTALTWAACAEGARRGCTAMTLTASEMGFPVYRAMGFVEACSIRTYLPPDSTGA